MVSAGQREASWHLLEDCPPLPRAQNLVLQMASLATKLFEVSNRSFRASVPTFLGPQSQSVALDSSPSTTKQALAAFTSLQTQLFEAIAQLQAILDLKDSKEKLNKEIRAKDTVLLAFANKLKDAERVLDMLVDDYADYRRPKRTKLGHDAAEEDSSGAAPTTVASRLNLADVLSYAHRISYTTFAPPEFGAGLAPLRGALPPAPQDEQMRASLLYTFADLDVGVPKAAEDKEKAFEPLIEVPPPPPAAVIPGLPNMVPPPGWKPGMPIELPTDFRGIPDMLQRDIPLPPPGWKPGDPIPLPPMSSLPAALPGANEPLPHVMPKGAEPIQVAHVQLDILEDDDSSDYSSDDGSSDDED